MNLIIFTFCLSLSYSSSVFVLLNKTQQHIIPAQSNLPIQFSLSSILQQMNYESEINVTLSLQQTNSSFDLLIFPNQTIKNEQYRCYNRLLQLGLFNQTNCNLQCHKCSTSQINECFKSSQICCCQNCNQNFYQITLLLNSSFSKIPNQDITFIIDNSQFLHAPVLNSTHIKIGYTIFTSFNYKYKTITLILTGVISFLILVQFLYCLCIKIQSKKSREALSLENEQLKKE